MKEEKNDISKLAGKLPIHKAPALIWDGIDKALSKSEQSEKNLQKAIEDLPQHVAPSSVWPSIENSLNNRNQKKKIWISWLKLAAIFILVFAVGTIVQDKLKPISGPTYGIVKNEPQQPPKSTGPANENIDTNKKKEVKEKRKITPEMKTKPEVPLEKKKITKPKPIRVKAYDAIKKTQLISLSQLPDNHEKMGKKGSEVLSPRNSSNQFRDETTPKFTRVKLAIHNEEESHQEKSKRSIRFALFKPLQYQSPKPDSSKQQNTAVLAARINL